MLIDLGFWVEISWVDFGGWKTAGWISFGGYCHWVGWISDGWKTVGGFQMGGKRWVDFDQVECGYWQVDFGLERKWQSENDQSENGGAI